MCLTEMPLWSVLVFVCETKCVFVENGFVVSLCEGFFSFSLSLSLVTAHLLLRF